MPTSIRPGDVLAGRYRLDDLLDESRGARFWRAYDQVLSRDVAVHVIRADDERAHRLLRAARTSVRVMDRRILRVLDADQADDLCYVVNEWGEGISLDILLAGEGPLEPLRAAWVTSEVAGAIASAHDAGVAHGRLVPENVLLDHHGAVRVIGLAVDAALHGLPPDRQSADIVDLGGLLYAALTGRWAGQSTSKIPAAPLDGGQLLRPRKVRAGIPGSLDTLCVEVIDPGVGTHARAAYDLATARGITDYLRACVGDPDAMAEAEARDRVTAPLPTPTLDDLPEVSSTATLGLADAATAPLQATPPLPAHTPPVTPSPAATTPPDSPREPTATPAAASAGGEPSPASPADPPRVVEQPTEAGMPIFDDDSGDVSWMTARASKPAPPPPFEQPPERPLFAPDPPPGTPVRRPRPGAPVSTASQEFWPWDGTPDASTGSGSFSLEEEVEEVPGRRWLRLAWVIAAVSVLLLALVIAFNIGRGRAPLDLGPKASDRSSSDALAQATPLTGLTAIDFDPQGNPPEENPDAVGRAVDGDPATAWTTQTYNQQLGPRGLKTGVGMIIDLGAVQDVGSVQVRFVGAPTQVELYLTDESPTQVAGLTPVASESAQEELSVNLPAGSSGRFLTIWMTALPPTGDGRFRGGVADVVVSG